MHTNWAGNYTYSTDQIAQPETLDELCGVVRKHRLVKALGARHSFNSIADCAELQVSLQRFRQMELGVQERTVTVGAGVTYGELAPWLGDQGFAVHNIASLPHISVVGACATATHGSGSGNGNLSTAVRAMEIVTASGEVKVFSRETLGERFDGAVVGLGALGLITKITLAVEPAFSMAQVVYEDLSFDRLEYQLATIFASGYSVSLFTDWQKHRATQVWVKRRFAADTAPRFEPEFHGAKAAAVNLHPLAADHSAENCTEQRGILGPSYERLPHFRMNFTPSSGAELQSEFFVPLERGYEAIRAVEELRDRITPHLFVTELRTVAADDLWMSPQFQRASLGIHFTWKPEWPAVKELLPQIEAKLAPFEPRPHWAKLFTLEPEILRSRYSRLQKFLALVAEYDPTGKFRNDFLATHLYD